jgi:uncharacterized protein YndB with AHSA1/START domain
MENTMQDVIVKEFTTTASKERVFKAISDPTQIATWFPNAVEGELKAGENVVFDFGKSGKAKVHVVAVDPTDYFAYRWIPGSAGHLTGTGDVLDRPNTLVEFRLEEVSGGTKVMLKESGFASLPAEMVEKAFSQNTEGWDFMLGRLEKTLQS